MPHDVLTQVDAYKEKFHLNVPLFKDEENTDDVTNSASNSSDRLSSLDLSKDRIKSIDSRFSTFPTPPINEDEEDLPILEGPLNFVQMLDNSPEGTYVIQKVLISPTFYEQLFCTKVFSASFMCLVAI